MSDGKSKLAQIAKKAWQQKQQQLQQARQQQLQQARQQFLQQTLSEYFVLFSVPPYGTAEGSFEGVIPPKGKRRGAQDIPFAVCPLQPPAWGPVFDQGAPNPYGGSVSADYDDGAKTLKVTVSRGTPDGNPVTKDYSPEHCIQLSEDYQVILHPEYQLKGNALQTALSEGYHTILILTYPIDRGNPRDVWQEVHYVGDDGTGSIQCYVASADGADGTPQCKIYNIQGNTHGYKIYLIPASIEFLFLKVSDPNGGNKIAWMGLYPGYRNTISALNVGGTSLVVGIDLGTTNTHVYLRRGGAGQGTELASEGVQEPLVLVNKSASKKVLDKVLSFLPLFPIDDEGDRCPVRTALSTKGTHIVSPNHIEDFSAFLAHGMVEPETRDRDRHIRTDVKFADGSGDGGSLTLQDQYIQSLAEAIKWECWRQGESVQNLQVVFTHPLSMPQRLVNRLTNAYNNAFSGAKAIQPLSESAALLGYAQFVGAGSPYIICDIGGGTIDVAIPTPRFRVDGQQVDALQFSARYGAGFFYGCPVIDNTPASQSWFCTTFRDAIQSFLAKALAKMEGLKSAKNIRDIFGQEVLEAMGRSGGGIPPAHEYVDFLFGLERKLGLTNLTDSLTQNSVMSAVAFYYGASILFYIALVLSYLQRQFSDSNLLTSIAGIRFTGMGSTILAYTEIDEGLKPLFAYYFSALSGDQVGKTIKDTVSGYQFALMAQPGNLASLLEAKGGTAAGAVNMIAGGGGTLGFQFNVVKECHLAPIEKSPDDSQQVKRSSEPELWIGGMNGYPAWTQDEATKWCKEIYRKFVEYTEEWIEGPGKATVGRSMHKHTIDKLLDQVNKIPDHRYNATMAMYVVDGTFAPIEPVYFIPLKTVIWDAFSSSKDGN